MTSTVGAQFIAPNLDPPGRDESRAYARCRAGAMARHRSARWVAVIVTLFALVVPSTAQANIGIPMLALAWPVYWIAFIPVVIIESEYAIRRLGLSRLETCEAVARANAVSTMVGIPLTWGVMLLTSFALGLSLSFVPDEGIQQGLYRALFPLMSAWLGPNESRWVVYGAFVCLALPMWYGSVLIEASVLRRLIAERHADAIRSVVIQFNILTYALIVFAVGIYTAWSVADSP